MSDESHIEVDNDGLAGKVEYFQQEALRQAIKEFAEKHNIELEEE